jgi:hypothetical protein
LAEDMQTVADPHVFQIAEPAVELLQSLYSVGGRFDAAVSQ